MFILTIIPIALNTGSPSFENNPTQRLAEIRSKISAAEIRIRDLEALLTELILNPTGDVSLVDPLGSLTFLVDDPTQTTDRDYSSKSKDIRDVVPKGKRRTSDANLVRQELYAARAYEGELRTAEQFWNQIVQANKEAEKDTHELFKRA